MESSKKIKKGQIQDFISNTTQAALDLKENKTNKPEITITGTITSTPTQVIVNAGWEWRINNVEFSKDVAVPFTPPLCATGNTRLDYIVPNNSGGFTRIAGQESTGTVIAPILPYPNFYVTFFTVTDSLIENENTSHGLIIGDSTIAPYEGQSGVDSFLITQSDVVNGTTITNQAVAGATINDQKITFLADENKGIYDWIVIQIGLNDVGFFEPDAQIIARYQSLIDTIILHKKNNAIIIVATMIPAKRRWISSFGQTNGSLAQTQWENINFAIMGGGENKIMSVSQRVDNHTFALSDGNGNLAKIYDTGDGIHENNKGRFIIANSWRVSINKAGFLNQINPFVFDNYFNNNESVIYTKSGNFSVGTTENPLPLTLQSDVINLPFYRDISSNLLLRGAVAGLAMETATGFSGFFDYDNNMVFYSTSGSGVVLSSDFIFTINQITKQITFNTPVFKVNGTISATEGTAPSNVVVNSQLSAFYNITTAGTINARPEWHNKTVFIKANVTIVITNTLPLNYNFNFRTFPNCELNLASALGVNWEAGTDLSVIEERTFGAVMTDNSVFILQR